MAMEFPEMIGFISFSLLASIVACILYKRDKFAWSLFFWCAASVAWFIYNKANAENSLWFTDFDAIGVFTGFFGVVCLGLFYALQTFLLFELSVEYCDRAGSKGYIVIPICTVIMGILLILVEQNYLTSSWIWIPVAVIVAGIIIAMWGEWDDMDGIFSWMSLIMLLLVAASYVYTFPKVIESSAWLFAIVFFWLLFRKGDSKDFLLDLGPKVKSTSQSSAQSLSVNLHNSVQSMHGSQGSPMMIVSFKGKYYLNGMKQINRKIRCSLDESHIYTSYMYDREKQKAWILAEYPGADLEKGWSLNVNITRE